MAKDIFQILDDISSTINPIGTGLFKLTHDGKTPYTMFANSPFYYQEKETGNIKSSPLGLIAGGSSLLVLAIAAIVFFKVIK